MKISKFWFIVLVVAVVHIVALCFIGGCSDSNEDKAAPPKDAKQETNAPAPLPVGGTDNAAELKPIENAPESSSPPSQNASTSQSPTSATSNNPSPAPQASAVPGPGRYFKSAPKQLSKKLTSMIGIARAGLVLDQDTKQILWSKSADTSYPIASLTKLMTSLLLMEQVKAGKASLQDKITVTDDDIKIMSKWGKGCYLGKGEVYTLEELLKAMMIKSANDCAYLAGRHLAGSDEQFIARMNARAKQLGLTSFEFLNANGYPIKTTNERKENKGTATDIAYLADRVSCIPEIMKWAGTKLDCLRENANKFDLPNTNHLLRDKVPGVTGLKTGYTDTAGYCIVVTCEREGRHIMVVLLGCDAPSQNRDNLAKALLDWAYAK